MTTTDNEGVTTTLLQKISDAFNSNNIDSVMACFTEDAIFDHASGPDINGSRYQGNEALRTVFGNLFKNVKNVSWETIDERICGDKAYCEYIRRATLTDGQLQEFLSIDVLTFEGGLISHKNTYYKNRIGDH